MGDQIINEIADWRLIRKAIEQGVRIDIDLWKPYRDLRLKVMLRYFGYAGQFDSSVYQWNEHKIYWNYPSQGTRLVYGDGMLEVALFDSSYGADRWFRWKNKGDIYEDQVYVTSPALWTPGNYPAGTIKFWLGSLWSVNAANGTSECPVTIKKTEPNVQYEYSDKWALFYAGPPNCFYNDATQRLETKIRADIWQKNHSYSENDCVSWNADTRNGQTANPVCWRAKRDIAYKTLPPHQWHGENWSANAWPKEKKVLASDGIRVFQAKNKIQNIATLPENNSNEWLEREDLACEWELTTGYTTYNDKWQLVPDWGNFECDWNVNFPGLAIFNDIVREDEDEIRDYRQCHPSLYFPRQVEPGAIHEEIIYAYNEAAHTNQSLQRGKRYKKGSSFKVSLDHTFLTRPEHLGPIFGIRARMGYWQKETFPYQIFIEQRDAHGVLNAFLDGFNKFKSFPGNQYINYGNLLERNSPEGNWSQNDKLDGSLHSGAEIVMNDNALRLPASSIYTRNWKRMNFSNPPAEPSVGSIYYIGTYPNGDLQRKTETGWEGVSVEDIDSWPDYPFVNDECWGTAESGLRTFLVHKHQKYDWAYNMDTHTKYYPFGLITEVFKQALDPFDPNNPPTESQLMDQWDMNHDGDYFETFKYTCGRVRPFMRAQERGVPDNFKDTWNPSFSPYGYMPGTYDMGCKWFAPLTKNRPTIEYFDDKFTAIVPFEEGLPWLENMPYKKWDVRTDNGKAYFAKNDVAASQVSPANVPETWQRCKVYSFAINGENRFNNADQAMNIKDGWMLHLFNMNGSSYPEIVSNDPDLMKCVYVLDTRYDTENNRTIVTVSDTINIGTQENSYFTKAGWSKEICQRHDASAADYTMNANGELSYTLKYEVKLEALLDLYDLLEFAIYLSANPNLELIQGSFHNSTTVCDGSNIANAANQQNALIKAAMEQNPLQWPTTYYSNPGVSGRDLLCVGTDPGDEYEEVMSNRVGLATAMRCLSWNPPLAELPSNIEVRISIEDMLDDYDMLTSQTAGGISTRFARKPEDVKWRYKFIELVVGSESFFKLIPEVFNYKTVISWAEFQSTGYYIDYIGGAHVGRLIFDTDNVFVVQNYNLVPMRFFEPTFYYTVGPRVLQIDNKPPRPNPPVANENPQAYLKYIMPFDLLTQSQQNSAIEWEKESTYNQGDLVWRWYNGRKHLFTVLNFIAVSDTKPLNDPTNFQWHVPYVELRVTSTCCNLTDYEASNPVKYWFSCQQDTSFNTTSGLPNWLVLQKADVLLRTVNLDISDLTGSTSNPSGTITRISCSGVDAGDFVEIIGTNWCDGVYTAPAAGYIEFDIGHYIEETFGTGCLVINRTKTYSQSIWDTDPDAENSYKNMRFAWQGRDSANDVQGVPDNVTDIGRFIKIEEPTDFIDFYDGEE